MPIESTSILYVGVGFLVVVLFCKAFEIIVERATILFVGKKKVRVTSLFIDEKDVIDSLRTELNELNIKIDALRIKLDGNFDALKIEVNALNNKLESTARMTEQSSLLQALPTPIVEDTRGNGEDTWTRDALVNETSMAPAIGESTSKDVWTRDVGKSDSVVNTKGAVMEVAMAKVHQASYPKEIAPNCKKCGKPMLLRKLHPGRYGHYNGDFECEACGWSVTKVVTFAPAA